MCLARNSLISRWRGTVERCPYWDFYTNHDSRHAELASQPASSSGLRISSVRFIERLIQLHGEYRGSLRLSGLCGGPANSPGIRKRFPLRQVIREFLKIAEPNALVLPMDIAGNAHRFSVPEPMMGIGCGGRI